MGKGGGGRRREWKGVLRKVRKLFFCSLLSSLPCSCSTAVCTPLLRSFVPSSSSRNSPLNRKILLSLPLSFYCKLPPPLPFSFIHTACLVTHNLSFLCAHNISPLMPCYIIQTPLFREHSTWGLFFRVASRAQGVLAGAWISNFLEEFMQSEGRWQGWYICLCFLHVYVDVLYCLYLKLPIRNGICEGKLISWYLERVGRFLQGLNRFLEREKRFLDDHNQFSKG